MTSLLHKFWIKQVVEYRLGFKEQRVIELGIHEHYLLSII